MTLRFMVMDLGLRMDWEERGLFATYRCGVWAAGREHLERGVGVVVPHGAVASQRYRHCDCVPDGDRLQRRAWTRYCVRVFVRCESLRVLLSISVY